MIARTTPKMRQLEKTVSLFIELFICVEAYSALYYEPPMMVDLKRIVLDVTNDIRFSVWAFI